MDVIMKFLKLKKLGILGTIIFFSIASFLNNPLFSNASVSQSVLGVAKGGTNANNVESAQKNLGRTDIISFDSTDNQFPSSKAVYDYIDISLDNKFVAVGTGGNIAYSNGGISWQEPTQVGSINWRSAIWGAGKFVVLGGAGNFTYSATGEPGSWSEIGTIGNSFACGSENGTCKLSYINGRFYAGGQVGKIAYSDDGISWNVVNTGQTKSFLSPVTYGNGKYVIAGGTYGYDGIIGYSSDGLTWTNISIPDSNFFAGLAFGNGVFTLLGAAGGVYSSDGVVWNNINITTGQQWRNIIYKDNRFLAVSESSYLTSSSDGINYETPYKVFTQGWWNIIASEKKYILVGIGGYISYAKNSNILDWQTPIKLGNQAWYGIAQQQ
jgi:hypothetical protein